MMRGLRALPVVALLVGSIALVGSVGPASAGSGGKQLTYQISDARGYGYKASIPEQVIKAAPKCDAKTDKYHCDRYIHTRNCPKKLAFGNKKLPPDPLPPENVDGVSGGAGQGEGEDPNGTGVPQSSAVRLNRLLSLGALGQAGEILQANGLAARQYTELGSPPWEYDPPISYTETDAFTNQSTWEERCIPKASVKDGRYTHVYSRSLTQPETFHYAECYEDECQFNGGPVTPSAEHGVTEVHLVQNGGTVRGTISALLENLKFPGDFFAIKELHTFVSFESDGTPDGLRWKVISTAQGASLAGQPINLPQGKAIVLGTGDEAVSVGMAGPYVDAAKDGGTLKIVAPGLFVATSQQTAFLAGSELSASFGRAPVQTFPSPPIPTPGPSGDNGGGPTSSDGGTGPSSSGVGPTTDFGQGGTSTSAPTSPLPPSEAQFALLSRSDSPWAPIGVITIGLLGFLLVFLRWAQQFEWGRRMYAVQPIRGFQWLYRAFLKP